MKSPLFILVFVLVFFFGSCSTLPEMPEKWIEMERNACLPNAILFRESLRKYGVYARVLKSVYVLNGKMVGHSMVVFIYPKDSTRAYVYDRMGSTEVFADIKYPEAVAKEALYKKYDYPSNSVVTAAYIEE